MMMMNIREEIIRNYKTPGHPTAFSNPYTVYKFYNRTVPLKHVKQLLSSIESHTLHGEFHKGVRNISYARFKRYQFQIDLCEIQSLSTYNNGFRYLLNVIDCFTRYAFVRPLKNKLAGTVLQAFVDILDEAVEKPYMIVCDKGVEFNNNLFKTFCTDNNIRLIFPQASTHAAYIERFNRTIQKLIYKYMTEFKTNHFIDKLSDIVKTYNNRFHRMIKMTPTEAETLPEASLQINNLISKREVKVNRRIPTLNAGQNVRISKERNVFTRGYEQQARDEIFNVKQINNDKRIPLYHLQDRHETEDILGGFYSNEIRSTAVNVFKIETILQRKVLHGQTYLLVKWVGYDPAYNSWINERDVKYSQ
jgi:hypothetical protein